MKKQTFIQNFNVKNKLLRLKQQLGWGVTQLNVPNAWVHTKGKGSVVYVIDTGFAQHTDLNQGMSKSNSRNFTNESTINDLNGHSTHCCGIIGSRNNSIGVVGVAPECTIVTGKVLTKTGSGTLSSLVKALEYAKTLKPTVINMSLGYFVDVPAIRTLIRELFELNIPIVAAAGNDGRSNFVNYPAKYPEVICATAFSKTGASAQFNSTGSEVDFSAPGVDVYSTWTKNRYAFASGTSMAAPFITGIIALLIAKHKKQEAETGFNNCKTINEINEHLLRHVDDKGVVGKDNNWGYGVINVQNLINENE